MSAPMSERDKLRVLLFHWIEHNREHADQFRRHAQTAGESASEIEAAADAMLVVNRHLATALKRLGGVLERAHGR